MKIIEEVIRKLKGIGPRPTGSEKELTFASWLRDKLKEIGIDVDIQDFRTVPTYTYPYLLIWGLLILSILLMHSNRILSFIVALVIGILEFRELDTYHNVSNLFRIKTSQNIIGKNSDKPDFVIMAHIDSTRTSIFFHPKFVTSPRTSMLLTTSSTIAIICLTIVNSIFPMKFWLYLGIIPSIYLFFLFLGHIHREIFMPFSPGGNDNGSGVAVALAASKTLKEEGIPFWVVFTGSEESGTYGAEAFMNEYKELLKDSFILNLDNLGAGRLTIATEEGMWKIFKVKDDWITVMEKSSEGIDVNFRPYLGLSTDATVFLVRGYNAGTIIALDNRGFPVNWHWPTDTVDALEMKNLIDGVTIAVNVGRCINAYKRISK